MTVAVQRMPRWARPWLAAVALLVACGSNAPHVEVYGAGDVTPLSVQAGTTATVTVQFRVRAFTQGGDRLSELNWLHLTCDVAVPPASGLTVRAGGDCDTRLSGLMVEKVVNVELTVSAAGAAPVATVELPVRFKACGGLLFETPFGPTVDEGNAVCQEIGSLQPVQVTVAPASPPPPPPPPAGPTLTGELLANAGFELLTQLGTLPGEPGVWRGDLSTVTAAVGAVTPRQGSYMLQFQATGAAPSAELVSSQVWQLVDVRPWAAAIDAGGVRALGSAWFHRVTGTALTDRRFDLRVLAFDGEAASVPARYAGLQQLGMAATQIDTDGTAWRQAQATLAVPPGTRWLLVEIYAYEDVSNDYAAPEFDGHYADDVSLRLQLP